MSCRCLGVPLSFTSMAIWFCWLHQLLRWLHQLFRWLHQLLRWLHQLPRWLHQLPSWAISPPRDSQLAMELHDHTSTAGVEVLLVCLRAVAPGLLQTSIAIPASAVCPIHPQSVKEQSRLWSVPVGACDKFLSMGQLSPPRKLNHRINGLHESCVKRSP